MATNRRPPQNYRQEDAAPIRHVSHNGEYSVVVKQTLNKWCVTISKVEDGSQVAEDFFPDKWKALARAQDFIILINKMVAEKSEAEAAGS